MLGLDLAPLNADTRTRFKIDPTLDGGVVVIAVRPDSPLKDSNVRVGDVIVEIAQQKVATPEELDEAPRRAEEGRAVERPGAGGERQGRDALPARPRGVRPRQGANSSCR